MVIEVLPVELHALDAGADRAEQSAAAVPAGVADGPVGPAAAAFGDAAWTASTCLAGELRWLGGTVAAAADSWLGLDGSVLSVPGSGMARRAGPDGRGRRPPCFRGRPGCAGAERPALRDGARTGFERTAAVPGVPVPSAAPPTELFDRIEPPERPDRPESTIRRPGRDVGEAWQVVFESSRTGVTQR